MKILILNLRTFLQRFASEPLPVNLHDNKSFRCVKNILISRYVTLMAGGKGQAARADVRGGTF
jgi:hypothetical protein